MIKWVVIQDITNSKIKERYSTANDCSEKEAEDKVIGKNELYFYNMYKQFGGWGNKIGVYPDTTDVELKIYRAIRELYQHKSLEKFYFQLLKDLALYNLSIGRYDLIDRSKLENIVRSLLSYDIPVDVADDDVRYIHNVIGKVKDTVQETRDMFLDTVQLIMCIDMTKSARDITSLTLLSYHLSKSDTE